MKTVFKKTLPLPMASLISEALNVLEEIRTGHTEKVEIALTEGQQIRTVNSKKL
jgi:hypothetical protein